MKIIFDSIKKSMDEAITEVNSINLYLIPLGYIIVS